MNKKFYSKLVEVDSLIIALDELDLSQEEKLHLASLLDSTIHHTILDVILSKLGPEDKKTFLERFNSDPENEELLDFLKDKVEDIDDEITKAAKQLKEELHEDIKEARHGG